MFIHYSISLPKAVSYSNYLLITIVASNDMGAINMSWGLEIVPKFPLSDTLEIKCIYLYTSCQQRRPNFDLIFMIIKSDDTVYYLGKIVQFTKELSIGVFKMSILFC